MKTPSSANFAVVVVVVAGTIVRWLLEPEPEPESSEAKPSRDTAAQPAQQPEPQPQPQLHINTKECEEMQNANTTSHFPNAFMMFTVEMRPVARLEYACVCVLSVNVCKREAAAAASGERGSSAVAEAATLATNEEKSTGAAMHTHTQTRVQVLTAELPVALIYIDCSQSGL